MKVEKIASSLEAYRPDGTPRPVDEAPLIRALRGEKIRDQKEIIRTPATGELRHRQVSAAPVRDATGDIIGSVSVVRDITERRKAEAALEKMRFMLSEGQKIAHVGSFEYEAATATTVWSDEECRIYGLPPGTPSPAYDVMLEKFIHRDDAAPLHETFTEAVKNGSIYELEHRIVRPDGSVRVVHDRAHPYFDENGELVRYVGATLDITERKQAEDHLLASEEALRQANESLEQRVRERTMDLQNLTEQLERSRHELRKLASELVMSEERERKRIAGVLHDEIAQTLAAARMRLDLLQSTQSDQKDKQTLQEVKAFLVQSIQETRALMNDVGNPLLFDLGLKAACDSLASRLMETHPVRISCDIPDAYKHLDPDVKTILYQVVRELLNNIAKHSRAQNAHVMIYTEGGHFRVQVTDDGVGFDPQSLGAPTAEGGYGLYSIRERLIAIGGSLRIESAPGTGTVVTAILPSAFD
jgi:PAS domain S-box-containing protein